MSGARTRHSSQSKIAGFLGTGRDILPSELPTLRSALRQGLKFKEEKEVVKSTYSDQELTNDVAKVVVQQWLKANSELVPPKVLTLKSLQRSIGKDWKRATNVFIKTSYFLTWFLLYKELLMLYFWKGACA